jgi:hypothetical protein
MMRWSAMILLAAVTISVHYVTSDDVDELDEESDMDEKWPDDLKSKYFVNLY